MQQKTLAGCRARVSTGSFTRTSTVKAHATLLSRPPGYLWIVCGFRVPRTHCSAHVSLNSDFPPLFCLALQLKQATTPSIKADAPAATAAAQTVCTASSQVLGRDRGCVRAPSMQHGLQRKLQACSRCMSQHRQHQTCPCQIACRCSGCMVIAAARQCMRASFRVVA